MNDLLLFASVILVGFLLNRKNPGLVDTHKDTLHKLAWYNLLLVALFQFWENGLDASGLVLIGVGFLLHLFPVSLAVLLNRKGFEFSKYLLAYSTFGGGNRGVLALALLSPTLLPEFFILDVGIFLSLLLIYPIAAQSFDNNKNSATYSFDYKLLLPVFITSGLILLGVALNTLATDDIPQQIFPFLKKSLLVIVSLYLGINLTFKGISIKEEVAKIFVTRLLGVFLPVTIISYFVFSSDFTVTVLTLITLATFLPVSSLAPQLTPNGVLREWITVQVLISSGLYVIVLSIIALIKFIYTSHGPFV
uniref:Uncharacterized protein n=1 Tax=Candidatus Kentrum eta TaxID=2126337 RepID=A0A450UVE4_9GAMM|nr:MAG: hypothetical protein BECKH772A_GA0070896_1000718 [Candidatus Kentron sp. H]VFJ90163.1 MAG: hypothetical protein BECKH772B_GA0070898_1000818 [Candidatus Kentron sp. H]VFJ96531.1 MAG: hypothetical protein BECKH772C_GA0070978_1000718 [Candidatus Kentron sp. H]